jgi:hypothetical protein
LGWIPSFSNLDPFFLFSFLQMPIHKNPRRVAAGRRIAARVPRRIATLLHLVQRQQALLEAEQAATIQQAERADAAERRVFQLELDAGWMPEPAVRPPTTPRGGPATSPPSSPRKPFFFGPPLTPRSPTFPHVGLIDLPILVEDDVE